MVKFSHGDPEYRAALREMAKRLTAIIQDQGLNGSELARRGEAFMPEDARFGPDNASNFLNGKRRPTYPFQVAISKALNVPVEDFMPPYLLRQPGDAIQQTPKMSEIRGKPGRWRVFIDREMSLKDAYRVVELLEEIEGGGNAS